MATRKTSGAWGELRQAFAELFARAPDDTAAKLELAVSARRFSRRTRAVVDDKLTFTATLMRAGEVDAANRMLAEVERDVRDEEAALLERVNEVRVAQAIKREAVTRARLARMLAAAMIGSVLLASSALGMTVVSMVTNDPPPATNRGAFMVSALDARARVDAPQPVTHTRKVRFAGKHFRLNLSQLRAYQELTTNDLGADEIDVLLAILPASLAQEVERALASATTAAAEVDAVDEPIAALDRTARELKRRAREEQAAQTDEPSPEPTEEPEEEPSDEESPDPSPSPSDEQQEEDDDEGLPFIDSRGES